MHKTIKNKKINQHLRKNYKIQTFYLQILNQNNMGGQNSKLIQGQSPIMIDHPRFQNAKVIQQKGNIYMTTSIGIDQREYHKWKQLISQVKGIPEYLLMAQKQQFSTKGLCGSSGTLNVWYEYFPYILSEQIQNRKKRKSKFQQCQLWFLLFNLSAAQIQMKNIFQSKIGDIRPQNIFINQQGQIKVSSIFSWPKQSTNFQKTFEHQQTLLSPEDMNKLELGGMDDLKNYQSEIFSIGLTILSAAMLQDFNDIYDNKKFKFKYDQANDYLNQWKNNTVYSEIFTAFISNMCSFQPEKRLTQKELWSWINKYEEQIKNKDDFVIDHAPLKIQKQIQQMRGESNINMLQETNTLPVVAMNPPPNFSFQQRSIVFPFMQGHQQADLRATSTPPIQRSVLPITNIMHPPLVNKVLSPRQINRGPFHPQQGFQTQLPPNMQLSAYQNNIQTAESMYTQVPAQIYQRQFGTIPPGTRPLPVNGFVPQQQQVISQQQRIISNSQQSFGIPQQQGYQPPMLQTFNPQQKQNGNFVYTRRIIDPNSNSVVAEQRIGEQQYHRGIGEEEMEEHI